MKYFIAEKF